MFLIRAATLAITIITSLPDFAIVTAAIPVGKTIKATEQILTASPKLMQNTPSSLIIGPGTEHIKQRRDGIHRCHDPVAEFGPAPSVEDCNDAIKKLQAVQEDITVKLVEGCYQAWSGNCTASVCPQRVGESTISPSLATKYMSDFVMAECISKGLRGWYMDRDSGVGVYLT
ncbi:hypothetical protein F5Y04DRAFT_289716 [Hypomontagnella monticulosa]|nr:hypothetical protein F5Y04DRAFT_289716 [Hypomontagnella monticulosa]